MDAKKVSEILFNYKWKKTQIQTDVRPERTLISNEDKKGQRK
jgi:hypothetical protein